MPGCIKIARFLHEDTYSGDESDPLSLNLYTYCANEPIMYDDPTGYAYGIYGDFEHWLSGTPYEEPTESETETLASTPV
jgi:hypothetical protein